MKAKLFVVSFTCMAMSLVVKAGDVIRLNQVGYLPGQEKVIVIDNVAPGRITVKNAAGKTVLKAKAGRMAVSPFTGKKRYVVDLSALKNAGDYTIEANGSTAKLHIADKVYHDIATAAAKSIITSASILHASISVKTGYPLSLLSTTSIPATIST